jgi:CrcB protein
VASTTSRGRLTYGLAVRSEGPVLAAVAAGGALGALARWGVGSVVGGPPGTVLVNVSGCLLLGLLVARVAVTAPHPLLRPFLGTGVLGGYTTFSTASTDAVHLAQSGAVPLAGLTALGTLALCLAATAVGLRAGRTGRGSVP